MIEYSKTTVFNVSAQTIVNTINCVGVMGAGLALECKLRYPQMYQNYVKQCRRKEVKVGHLYFCTRETEPYILNFPTKNHWKYPSRLEWIEKGLIYFLENYQQWGIQSVAFPKLGCDLGGLEWQIVEQIMQKYLLQAEDIQVIICLDTDQQPQGIEKEMLKILHNPMQWQNDNPFTDKEVEGISTYLPITRFKSLQKIASSEQYQRLFSFFYNKAYVTPSIAKLTPKEARLQVIILLQKLEITSGTMLKLRWRNFINQYNYCWLKLTEDDRIPISPEIYQALIHYRGDVDINTLVIHDLKNPDKPLNIITLGKLIKECEKPV